VDTLTRILSVLDHARTPQDIALPGFRAHLLRAARMGHWSIRVSGNWRVTLRFMDGDVFDVDYVDDH
jgi:proteic killer suppression protein